MLDPTHLLWTRIAAGVCVLIAVLLLVNLVRLRGRVKAAANWTAVEGEIVASEVQQPASHVSDDLNDATPIIRYRYRLGGKTLESAQIRIAGQPMTTGLLAARLVGRYPVGARVDVYVDPAAPENAVLERSRPGSLAAYLVITIVVVLVAAILVAHALAGRVLATANGVPLFAFAFPLVAFVIAASSIAAFVRGRRRAAESARWPTASGTIVSSAVIEQQIEETDKDNKSFPRKILKYQIDLRYAYRVGQRDFVGILANWGWEAIYGLRDAAEKAAARYAPGQHVTVYYDPAEPGNAVLEPDSRAGSLAPLLVGTLLAVAGAIFLVVFIKADFNG